MKIFWTPFNLTLYFVTVTFLSAAMGCRTPPPPRPEPLVGPTVRSEVTHFVGSALSGAVERDHEKSEKSDPETMWGVKVNVLVLEKLPETELEPLAPMIQLITVERGGEPIAPVARLGVRGRIGPQDDPQAFLAALEKEMYGRSAPVARLVGTLAFGVTAVFRVAEEGGKIGELRVSRLAGQHGQKPTASESVRLALVLEGFVAPEAEVDDSEPSGEQEEKRPRAPPPPIFQQEVILLSPQPLSSGGVAIFLPSPFRSSPAAALALVVELRPAAEWTDQDRPEYEAAVARCMEDLVEAADLVRQQKARALHADESVWAGLAATLTELDVPSRRRASLVFLAHATGARLTEDLALSASTDFTARLAGAVEREVGEQPLEDELALQWVLTRASYSVLAGALGERKTTPDLQGILALHAGEVGRHGPVIEEVLKASTGFEDFDARLVQENLIYLEDISPASRSRAFRWLRERGLAPEGYDPLSTVKDRRAALTRAAEKAEDTDGKAR